MSFFKKKPIEKPALTVGTPLSITIHNKSKFIQGFVLFGSCNNLPDNNCGNPEDVEISISGDHFRYESLLFDLLSENIEFGMIRLLSNKSENILQTLTHENRDIFTSSVQTRELKMQMYLDAYQFQSSILEAKIPIVINKRASLMGKIYPESSLTVMLFPVATVSLLNIDLGQDTVYSKKNALERLSGKNVPMTNVIQTPVWYFKVKAQWVKFKDFFKRKSK